MTTTCERAIADHKSERAIADHKSALIWNGAAVFGEEEELVPHYFKPSSVEIWILCY